MFLNIHLSFIACGMALVRPYREGCCRACSVELDHGCRDVVGAALGHRAGIFGRVMGLTRWATDTLLLVSPGEMTN